MKNSIKKIILITGASSGIGLSNAIYLTYKGYTVFGTSRNPENIDLNKLIESYKKDHTKFIYTSKEKLELKAEKILLPEKLQVKLPELVKSIKYYKMDVTDSNSVNECIQIAWKDAESLSSGTNGMGGIDVLINNAGDGYFGSVEELSVDLAKKQFDTNYFGQIRTIQALLPLMRKRGFGQIVNTSSMAGLLSIPFQSQYSASKAAILRMTESLRNEVAKYNIKISSLLPGDINTNFNAHTPGLNTTEEKDISKEIQNMVQNLPSPDNSVYIEDEKKVWKTIISNLIVSPPPIIISRKIEKIITSKNPKSRYLEGDFMQKLLMGFLLRIFSDSIAVKLIGSYYDL